MSFPLYFDEDQDEKLAIMVWRDGFDLLTTKDAGRAHQGIPDERQLEFAAGLGRAIVTSNERDFIRIYRRWWAGDVHHSGIIIVRARKSLKDAYDGLVQLQRDYPDGIDDLILQA